MNYNFHLFLLNLLIFFISKAFADCYSDTGGCTCLTSDTVGGLKCGSELNNGCSSDSFSIFQCNPGGTKICRYGPCTYGCCATSDGNSYCCMDYACSGCKNVSKIPNPPQPQPPQPHNQTTDCNNPSPDSCNFYSDCLEKKFNCGPNGYPIGYGLKNCENFANEINLFSNDGKKWVLKTMLCLQNALVQIYNNNTATCSEIKDTAFRSHAKCYIESGVCSLPTEWWKLFEIIDIRDIVGSWEGILEVIQTAEGCAELYAWLIGAFCKKHHYCVP
ncbi:hypothetical protein RclHR1_00030033 [Rhizophagus clarus]|nr:hypothetical protein RclHR1_00030033 [Rhizophagus clarus]